MIIEYVVPSLALKIIPVKNTKSFMKVLTVISLNLEILRGGRAQAVLEIQVEVGGGVKKPCHLSGGRCGFFMEEPICMKCPHISSIEGDPFFNSQRAWACWDMVPRGIVF